MKSTLPVLSSGSSAFEGPGLSRRAFLELGAGGLVASWYLTSPAAAWAATATGAAPKNTAKNVILVFLPGAPSQIDTWDLKEGAWTPSDFAPTSFGAGLRFPAGLLPQMANHLGDAAIVRSLQPSALVHGLGRTSPQIA